MRPFNIFLTVAFCIPLLLPAQEKQKNTKPETSDSQSRSAPENQPPPHNTGFNNDRQALQADIKKMRVLVHLMQNNLAGVTSTQDPLKHQFELEIEMWQLLIDQMERTVQGGSGR